jgi:hypothetical protein
MLKYHMSGILTTSYDSVAICLHSNFLVAAAASFVLPSCTWCCSNAAQHGKQQQQW